MMVTKRTAGSAALQSDGQFSKIGMKKRVINKKICKKNLKQISDRCGQDTKLSTIIGFSMYQLPH